MEMTVVFQLATLLIAGGILMFAILSFVARRRRIEIEAREQQKRIEAGARERRILPVVEEFVRLSQNHPPLAKGPRAFMSAGGKSLVDDGEVREAVDRIVARVGAHDHPFGRRRVESVMALPDLKVFTARLDHDGQNFNDVLDELLAQ